jgi:hypothetical protein
MTGVRSISNIGNFYHDDDRSRDITVGRATVRFSKMDNVWIIPGGRKISSQAMAMRYAGKMNALMK